jgi:hypothetical protein
MPSSFIHCTAEDCQALVALYSAFNIPVEYDAKAEYIVVEAPGLE